MLAPYRVDHPETGMAVEVVYATDCAQCVVRLGEQWRVTVPDELIGALSQWLDPGNVQIRY